MIRNGGAAAPGFGILQSKEMLRECALWQIRALDKEDRRSYLIDKASSISLASLEVSFARVRRGGSCHRGEIFASCTSRGEQTYPLAEVTIAVAATLSQHSENKTSQKGSQIVLQRLSKMTEKILRARFSALKDLFEKPPHSVTKHQANPQQIGLNRTGRKLRIVENS
jgi:hypothetical protein